MKDVDYESKVILSGILKYGYDGYADCMDIISEEHFSNRIHKTIYRAYQNLFLEGKDFSSIMIQSECFNMGLEPSMSTQIEECIFQDCSSINDIRECSHILNSNLLVSKAKNNMKQCIDSLSEMDHKSSVTDVFGQVEEAVFGLVDEFSSEGDAPELLGTYARKLLTEFAEEPSDTIGLPTPWRFVNESIGGGIRTGVHLIGGRAKSGKSSISIMTGLFLGQNDIPVLYLDTEMTKDNIIPRIVANLSDVDIKNIETGKYSLDHISKNEIDSALDIFESIPFHYKYVGGKSFKNILSTIRRWIYTEVGLNEKGYANQCLIIYDYFKLMSAEDMSGGISETQAMGFQISSLTDFCNKYQVPCLSFVQLNRSGINREETDTIFGSDKLLHLCNSFSIFKKKDIEERKRDGVNKGDRKLITLASRYGGEHEFGEYVSMQSNLNCCQLFEVEMTRNNIYEEKPENVNQVSI